MDYSLLLGVHYRSPGYASSPQVTDKVPVRMHACISLCCMHDSQPPVSRGRIPAALAMHPPLKSLTKYVHMLCISAQITDKLMHRAFSHLSIPK